MGTPEDKNSLEARQETFIQGEPDPNETSFEKRQKRSKNKRREAVQDNELFLKIQKKICRK